MLNRNSLIIALTIIISWLLTFAAVFMIMKGCSRLTTEPTELSPETYPIYLDEWSPTIHNKKGC